MKRLFATRPVFAAVRLGPYPSPREFHQSFRQINLARFSLNATQVILEPFRFTRRRVAITVHSGPFESGQISVNCGKPKQAPLPFISWAKSRICSKLRTAKSSSNVPTSSLRLARILRREFLEPRRDFDYNFPIIGRRYRQTGLRSCLIWRCLGAMLRDRRQETMLVIGLDKCALQPAAWLASTPTGR